MNTFRRCALLARVSVAALAVVVACVDTTPTSPADLRSVNGNMSKILPEYMVTAPYTYYCTGQYGISIPCHEAGGEYVANLNHFQISRYCNDMETSRYCDFDVGGNGGYDDASPYHFDEFDDSPESTPEERPDCNSFQPDIMVRMWCKAPAPAAGSARHTHLLNAIEKIRKLGETDPECADYAVEAKRLLDNGWLRIFPADSLPRHGGFAPGGAMGSATAYMGISDKWIDHAFDDDHAKTILGNRITLQVLLSHELDHLKNDASHLSGTAVGQMFTPNTSRCSGQAPPVGI